MSDKVWTRELALYICERIEPLCPEFGCHVALTGGCLYKSGSRKDLDLVFYRIRQEPYINKMGLFVTLHRELNISVQRGFGWIHKGTWDGLNIDLLFPEEDVCRYDVLATEQIEEMIRKDPYTIKYIPYPTENMFAIAARGLPKPYNSLTEWFNTLPPNIASLAKMLQR